MFDDSLQPSRDLAVLLNILKEEGLHVEIQNFGCDVPITKEDHNRYFFILAKMDKYDTHATAILPCAGPHCKPDIPWNWYDITHEVYVTPEDLADPGVFKRIVQGVASAPLSRRPVESDE